MRPINADIMVSQCIVPPYHPAMLEKWLTVWYSYVQGQESGMKKL